MAIVKRFNVNTQQATLDADIIENMSANDVSYDASTQYDENTVGDKLSELESQMIYDVTKDIDVSNPYKLFIAANWKPSVLAANDRFRVVDVNVHPGDELIIKTGSDTITTGIIATTTNLIDTPYDKEPIDVVKEIDSSTDYGLQTIKYTAHANLKVIVSWQNIYDGQVSIKLIQRSTLPTALTQLQGEINNLGEEMQDIQSNLQNEINNLEEEIQGIQSEKFQTSLSWVSIGDSLTYLDSDPGPGGPTGKPTKGYQTRIREIITFSSFTNIGTSGNSMVAYPYNNIIAGDIYTIALGVNDWRACTPVGTLDDYKNYGDGTDGSVTYFSEALRRIVNKCRAMNPESFIIIMTPRRGRDFGGQFPTHSTDANTAGIYLHQYADLLKEVARYESFPLVDQYYESGINDTNLQKYSYDNTLHPNDAGMQIIANQLFPVIKQVCYGL